MTPPSSVFRRGLSPCLLAILLISVAPVALANGANTKPANDVAASAKDNTSEVDAPNPDVKPGLAGSFLSSRFAKEHEDIDDASKYLKESLAHDPGNIKLKHDVLRASLLAGDTATATEMAKQLSEEAKTDPLVALTLMLDAFKQKDYATAQKIISNAPAAGLFGVVRPLMQQWVMIAQGAAPKAGEMQAAIDKSGFFAPFLTYHVALMNDVAGSDQAALEYYQKASAQPETTSYRVVEAFANYQERHGKWDEAQKLFDNYAKMNPDSSLLPGKITPQTEPVKPLIADANEGMAEVFFTTASILFGEDTSQDTFIYLRMALGLRPELPPAQLMLANLYEQSGDFTKAIATYDSMSKGTVFYRRGQVRKALNLEAMGKRDEAIHQLDVLASQYPNDSIALITKGDMLRVQEKYKDASDAYSEAIARSEPLKESDWPLLYARGISYERAGTWPKAEADFQRALKLEPNQPDVLNYLAYSWLTMGKNVVQARNYLEIARSARPDEPHIIDSMGVAKLLMGQYKEASLDFEKAVELMPEDPTVNDHLGDAYWRLGRKLEAKNQWNRALGFKPDADLTDQLHKKIVDGLPAAEPIAAEAAAPAAPTADDVNPDTMKKEPAKSSGKDAPEDDETYE